MPSGTVRKYVTAGAAAVLCFFVVASPSLAATDCTFTVRGPTMLLDADCFTDETIFVPDGMTLNGKNRTITVWDPPGGHFVGAVVANGGASAHVTKLKIDGYMLENVCDGGADRLRGIMFEGASGSITHCTVTDINQGETSGCQEGNAIEVRNAPFDGNHPDPKNVEVAHNKLSRWQKTGIVANGDVVVLIHHNDVDASAVQDGVAPNSVQLGFGAIGVVIHNNVEGNQWKGTSNYAASAILVYSADANVSKNNVRGNSDIGVFIVSDDGRYNNNRIVDQGQDHPNSGYDIGLGHYGTGNVITNNKTRGFDMPYDPLVTGGNNKSHSVIPAAQVFQ